MYSSPRNSDMSHLNVHKFFGSEVASKIQQVGITRDTIILVYHVSTFDPRLLRRFLESAGYFDLFATQRELHTDGKYPPLASV
jgi:hypothetical protein